VDATGDPAATDGAAVADAAGADAAGADVAVGVETADELQAAAIRTETIAGATHRNRDATATLLHLRRLWSSSILNGRR
jgi:hypothetical protein